MKLIEQSEPSGAALVAARVTPMMEQYIEIRAANPDCLLFYRMGDFYELFFDDAVTASRALGITLTKRGKHLGAEIPMCGVPVHSADDYLQKLIGLGYRVAVCEQIEDPATSRARGAKSVVRRAVTRLITPGTITEERLLESGRHNYLAALVRIAASDGEDRHALAWVDISTGEFRICECAQSALGALLGRIEPREVLVPEKLAHEPRIRDSIASIGAALAPLPASFFEAGMAEQRLAALFGVKTLEAFGSFSRGELAAAGALVAYVEKTQIGSRPTLEPPRHILDSEFMRLDAGTRANLELFRTISGARKGSLLAAIDRTCTAAGARLLAERIASPSRDVPQIEERLDAVAFFVERAALRTAIREALGAHQDLHRAIARLALERGGPRDLDCIRAGLESADQIADRLSNAAEPDLLPVVLRQASSLEADCRRLAADLRASLADNLPLLKRDGNFIRAGYESPLDEARGLRDESRGFIARLQSSYANATGIRSLKVRHNNVLGYFVEVTATQAPALQSGASGNGAERFIHRQTLANVMRFSTAELGELEQKIASAADRALAIELSLFDALAGRIAAADSKIRAAARALAEVDVAAALAELAATEGYVRPKVDSSLAFRIEGGRHPVVEQALSEEGQSFVGNDCDLGPDHEVPETGGFHLLPWREKVSAERTNEGGARDPHRADDHGTPPLLAAPQPRSPSGGEGHATAGKIWLLTGPNMAGKSTFLRQNALIAILAQTGSFVPAKRAHIGIVDALFSRVGAADDLARGRSTFMVEMVETAAILNQAGSRALVILDEIGRGTATFDGLSIAWATVEHLHDVNGARALFATHYHELTALAAKLPRLANATMKVKEWKGDVVFLHEVAPGAADRSYGIQVAKLAGLPPTVIQRARTVLESLEKSDRSRPKPMIDDLPLFAVKPPAEAEAEDPARAALMALHLDDLSPREALEFLYELKRLAGNKPSA